MSSATQCVSARVIDRGAVRAFAHEDIVQCLQASVEPSATANLRKQHLHACNALDVSHRPAMPFSIIGKSFNVSKATVRWNYKRYLIQIAHYPANGSILDFVSSRT
jgi:hypothetical protein